MREGRFSGNGRGISALFDALMFFVILLAATGALTLHVSNSSTAAAESEAARDLGRYCSEVQVTALSCTVGPLNCTVNGSESGLGRMTVIACIVSIIDLRISGIPCDTANLTMAVNRTYSLLTGDRFHFAVLAELGDMGSPLFLSDSAGGAGSIGTVRWTNSVPLAVAGSEGTLTLFLWR